MKKLAQVIRSLSPSFPRKRESRFPTFFQSKVDELDPRFRTASSAVPTIISNYRTGRGDDEKGSNPLITSVVLVASVIALILVGAFILKRREPVLSDPAAVAVGLRGESRVSKPLSQTQQERLESHFLDMPSMPASRGSSGGPIPAVVSQANAINKFNQSQGSEK